jgi:hypothetical protein
MARIGFDPSEHLRFLAAHDVRRFVGTSAHEPRDDPGGRVALDLHHSRSNSSEIRGTGHVGNDGPAERRTDHSAEHSRQSNSVKRRAYFVSKPLGRFAGRELRHAERKFFPANDGARFIEDPRAQMRRSPIAGQEMRRGHQGVSLGR